MRTLLDEEFAPTTNSIGFVEAPLAEVSTAYESWQREIYSDVTVRTFQAPLSAALRMLEPLTSVVRRRVIWVSAGERWSAYFDCGWVGSDPGGPVRVLSERLGVRGAVTFCSPSFPASQNNGQPRYGSVQLWLFGPHESDRRTIAATYDDRWEFETGGIEQPFEELEAYKVRRKRDRFTSEMLDRYCQALGIDVFEPDTYGPDGVWFHRTGFIDHWSPPGSYDPDAPPSRYPPRIDEVTFAQAQERLGIVPGSASELPG